MSDSEPQCRRSRGRSSFPALAAICIVFCAPSVAQNAFSPAADIEIFFPPVPPPLGAVVPQMGPMGAQARPAPSDLAPYPNEPFYAPLSVRLARNDLNDALKFRIDSYRAGRNALQAELRARIDTLKVADSATRQRRLEEFSREAGPRAAELENEADRIREDLATHGSAANEYLRWEIDLDAAKPAPDRDLVVKCWAVETDSFFREGLSAAQRRLLREVAIETAEPGGTGASTLFFSPDTVRIPVPAGLPPELSAKIDAYRREKYALKNELLRALYPTDKGTPLPVETRALAALAAEQAPRFAALERMAEDIRRGLASMRDPSQLPELPPAIPPELATRIAAYRQDEMAVQKELLARVDEIKATPQPAGDSASQSERVSRAIAAFLQENSDRYASLRERRDAIRADVAKLAEAEASGGVSADALLKQFQQSLRQLETVWNYREYQYAALQPGLSPELRRLLFGEAFEKLALPLPGGEIEPP